MALELTYCPNCRVQWGMDAEIMDGLRRTGRSFFCPNGHSLSFTDNELARLSTPSAELTFELVYYARLQPLSASNDSNWMTLNVPQALFAACMVEACRFVKNTGRQVVWEDTYGAASGALKAENSERQADRTTVFVRP